MIFTLSHKKPEVVDVGVSAIFLFENSDFQKSKFYKFLQTFKRKLQMSFAYKSLKVKRKKL